MAPLRYNTGPCSNLNCSYVVAMDVVFITFVEVLKQCCPLSVRVETELRIDHVTLLTRDVDAGKLLYAAVDHIVVVQEVLVPEYCPSMLR